MSLQQLFDHLDDLIRTPEDVARLEAAILDLAVRGKLTRQEEGDEPACNVVEQIRRLKGDTSTPLLQPVESREGAYGLPKGWLWTTLGEVAILRDAARIPLSKEVREGRKGSYDYYGASGVIDKIDDYLFDKPLLLVGEDGANLLLRSTPIAFIAKGKYWVNNHAHVLDSLDEVLLEYMRLYINATDLRPYVTGTAQPKMNQAKMVSIPIALPPYNEQRRIVAKVDELLAQTRALAANLRRAQAEVVTANQAALHRLETAEEGASLQAAWRTLADSFDLLYDDPRPLAALRQAILQLAVRGKLTRQEEGDERVKNSSSVSGNDANFHLQASDTLPRVEELPKGWRLHQLQSCFRFIDYRGKTPAKTESGMRLITAKNVKQGFLADAPKEYVKPDIYDSWMTRGIPSPNAVLFTTEAPLGNVAVLDTAERIVLAQRIIALEPRAETIYSRYALYALMSSLLRNQIQRLATGTTAQGIKASRLKLVLLPVPPLVEQKRIAAKVNELMSMCDALERRLCQAEEVRQAAVESVLAHI